MDELQKMLSAVQKRAEGYQSWANQVERVLDGQEPLKIGKCSGVGGWLVVCVGGGGGRGDGWGWCVVMCVYCLVMCLGEWKEARQQLTYDLQVEYMNTVIDTYHPTPRAHTSRLGVPPCPDIRRLLALI